MARIGKAIVALLALLFPVIGLGVNTVFICPVFNGIKCPLFAGIKCPLFIGIMSFRPLRLLRISFPAV